MKNLHLLAVAMAAAVLPPGYASDGPGERSKAYIPPVMREAGNQQTAVFTLPVPPKILDGPPPVLRHAAPTPDYPAEFVRDGVAYLGNRIDQWQQPDAAGLLGAPIRQRPSVDEDGKSNGLIYAYSDPLRRYREFELYFEGNSGRPAHHLRLPHRNELEGLPPRLWIERFQGGRRGRTHVLFLPQPAPGRTRRCHGKCNQSGDLLKPLRRPVRLTQQCSSLEKIGV